MENPIKMDDLGVPLFLETPISKSGGMFFFFKSTPQSLSWSYDSPSRLRGLTSPPEV